MGKKFNQWLDEFVEQGANPKDITNWPEEAGGGSYTAGNGITITEENVISVDTSAIQEKLTAGNGIAISEEGIISLDIAVADQEGF